jgi:hypothetical protein
MYFFIYSLKLLWNLSPSRRPVCEHHTLVVRRNFFDAEKFIATFAMSKT